MTFGTTPWAGSRWRPSTSSPTPPLVEKDRQERMTFASLGLSDALVHAVTDLGFRQPTPVQVAAIPAILAGGDLWASAKTGSGKTAAFLLPVLHALGARPRPAPRPLPVHGLVLVPTRELAVQTAAAIEALGAHLP